jgi:hypothetical protein
MFLKGTGHGDETWIHMIQNIGQLQVYVNTVVNVSFHRKRGASCLAEQHLLLKKDSAPWHKLFSPVKPNLLTRWLTI